MAEKASTKVFRALPEPGSVAAIFQILPDLEKRICSEGKCLSEKEIDYLLTGVLAAVTRFRNDRTAELASYADVENEWNEVFRAFLACLKVLEGLSPQARQALGVGTVLQPPSVHETASQLNRFYQILQSLNVENYGRPATTAPYERLAEFLGDLYDQLKTGHVAHVDDWKEFCADERQQRDPEKRRDPAKEVGKQRAGFVRDIFCQLELECPPDTMLFKILGKKWKPPRHRKFFSAS